MDNEESDDEREPPDKAPGKSFARLMFEGFAWGSGAFAAGVILRALLEPKAK